MSKKIITENLEKEVAREVAKLVFGTDEDLFVKKKGYYVEIRVLKEEQVLQIQHNGTMMLMKKNDQDGFYHPIPNCLQVAQLLELRGYKLPTPGTYKD